MTAVQEASERSSQKSVRSLSAETNILQATVQKNFKSENARTCLKDSGGTDVAWKTTTMREWISVNRLY